MWGRRRSRGTIRRTWWMRRVSSSAGARARCRRRAPSASSSCGGGSMNFCLAVTPATHAARPLRLSWHTPGWAAPGNAAPCAPASGAAGAVPAPTLQTLFLALVIFAAAAPVVGARTSLRVVGQRARAQPGIPAMLATAGSWATAS